MRRVAAASATVSGRDQRAGRHLLALLDRDRAIVPLTGDGTSMDAFSVSSVMSGSSTRISAPDRHQHLDHGHVLGVAQIGNPDLDDAHSSAFTSPKMPAQKHDEARSLGAVDDSMIVGQRQRQHQPRHERALVEHRLLAGARYAEDRHFGRIDDRREGRAADAAEARDGEASRPASRPPSVCRRAPSPTAPPVRARCRTDCLRSASRITGTTRPFGVSAANPMWKYFLRDRDSRPPHRARH